MEKISAAIILIVIKTSISSRGSLELDFQNVSHCLGLEVLNVSVLPVGLKIVQSRASLAFRHQSRSSIHNNAYGLMTIKVIGKWVANRIFWHYYLTRYGELRTL